MVIKHEFDAFDTFTNEDWKRFERFLVLDIESPEHHVTRQQTVKQLIYLAQKRAEGIPMKVFIISDPRRVQRRFVKEILRKFLEAK